MGNNPHTGKALVVLPRRLLKADAGCQFDESRGSTNTNVALSSLEGLDDCGGTAAAISDSVDRPVLSFFDDDPDEDPLDLGLCVGYVCWLGQPFDLGVAVLAFVCSRRCGYGLHGAVLRDVC